jgi:dihydroorotate dehydrogenase
VPDWSYLTVFAPALRWLPTRRARDLTLGAFGSLVRLRCGPQLISAFRHMQPPAAAGLEVLGLRLISRVGIGGEVDPRLLATSSLGLLGVGFVEVGPVTLEPYAELDGPCISADGAAMQLQAHPVSLGLEETRRRLEQRACSVPLVVRIAPKVERNLRDGSAHQWTRRLCRRVCPGHPLAGGQRL